MVIEELVLHPAQLLAVDLVSLECQKYEIYDAEKVEVKIAVEVEATEISEKKGTTVMKMRLYGDGFSFIVLQKGLFEFNLEKEIAIVRNFLETQGVKLMWPYFREVIYDVSGRMLEHPISIPTIDVLATIKKATDTEE